jgi:NAD(P)H-hydrate epimerase
VLVIGGSVGLTGAVSLAARAASRSGAGVIQAAVPTSLNDILETRLTEEMTLPMPETAERTLSTAALEPLLARSADADAVALGSGLSRHREAAEIARRVAAECERPLVLDADGLNAFEEHRDHIGRGRSAWILTPHVGEMHRLTGLDPQAIEGGRIDVAREWARRWRAVLVLKGAPTVTASPDGQVTVNPNGNPGMATAGTGDVLTGVIAALLAQGVLAHDAACLGVYLHGLAAEAVSQRLGDTGAIASDLLEELPRTFHRLRR